MEKIEELVKQMTLEEKAGMCSGRDFWHLKGVERLGIPSIMVADGPHGLRKQDQSADHLGINDSIKAVCFPSAAGLAASFDKGLLRRVGETLGEECQAENVAVLLGPAINIKRSPLCGRNFEYMSEDPFVSSKLAAAYIDGLQSRKVGASLKHFAVNNQEKRRSTVSSQVSERALRELYLASFEGAVKEAKPWTVMCSYNRINGEYASESHWLLTEILRDEWGFDGFLVTDWSACNERVKGLLAGQDLEMPDSGGANDRLIVEAVQNGTLKEEILDQAVMRILDVIFRYADHRDAVAEFDRQKHHEIAREAACQSMVLLKNDKTAKGKKTLPLKKGGKYAFIGCFAKNPRYQGGGSSHINSYKVSNALESCGAYAEITFAEGFQTAQDQIDKEMLEEAVKAARESDAAVIFAGLPESIESEAYDREHMGLPKCQNVLIREVAAVQPNTVVVLHNGSPVEMPWEDQVPAILESYLAGEAVGEAQAALLFGEENPCGRLAETFPLRVQDNPAWLDFGGNKDVVHYGEGIFVGYRYYDTKEMPVLFPFGHGLSYTEFAYDNLRLSRECLCGEEQLEIRFRVRNTGERAGREAPQVYLHKKNTGISRPWQELKGFEKVGLAAGEEAEVVLQLDRRSFSYYDEQMQDWCVEPGEYEILIGASSRDIRLRGSVMRTDSLSDKWVCHRNTTLGEIMKRPAAKEAYRQFLKEETGRLPFEGLSAAGQLGEGMKKMAEAILSDSPLRSLRSFYKGKVDDVFIERLIDRINHNMDN
ncbi:glycosyl hydrolase [Lachnospiraceae bacterium]|jgi:beta-glucosidase|nr:glycosyl hydrolase [Lachnospiraceae bacterium]